MSNFIVLVSLCLVFGIAMAQDGGGSQPPATPTAPQPPATPNAPNAPSAPAVPQVPAIPSFTQPQQAGSSTAAPAASGSQAAPAGQQGWGLGAISSALNQGGSGRKPEASTVVPAPANEVPAAAPGRFDTPIKIPSFRP